MKRSARVTAMLVLLAAFAPTARGGDWPRFLGPNGTGVVEDGGRPQESQL